MKFKRCPFCGDESGSTNILCGENNDGKWWCKSSNYNTRTPSPSAQKVIEAAIAQADFMNTDMSEPLTDDTVAMWKKAAYLQKYIWATTNAVIEYQKETP